MQKNEHRLVQLESQSQTLDEEIRIKQVAANYEQVRDEAIEQGLYLNQGIQLCTIQPPQQTQPA